MKQTHIPGIGFEYELEKKTIVTLALAMTKENSKLSENGLRNFIRASSNLSDSLLKRKQPLINLFGKIQLGKNYTKIDEINFVKYVPRETYENYIKNGSFQLSSLKKYREIERSESRDEREGFSYLIINSGTRQIIASVLSGFNYLLLCGTDSITDDQFMRKKFGEVRLEIKNISSFADKIMTSIGAKSWDIQKVQYTDFKAFTFDYEIKDLNGVGPDLSEELFSVLYSASYTPSIFSKPTFFSPENEFRLIFEFDENVKNEININDISLLDDISIT